MLLASTNASWHCCHIKAVSDGFELDEGSALTGTKWTFKPRFLQGKGYFQHSYFCMKAPGLQQIGGRIALNYHVFLWQGFQHKSAPEWLLCPDNPAALFRQPCLHRKCWEGQVTLLSVLSATTTKGFGSPWTEDVMSCRIAGGVFEGWHGLSLLCPGFHLGLVMAGTSALEIRHMDVTAREEKAAC